jgi:subtilase family serine protease
VIAKVDPLNVLDETSDANNTRLSSITIGPDLRISSLSAPSSVPSGGTVNLSDTTLNQGGAAVGASTTRFFLSTNPTLDAGDIPVALRAVPALAASQSSSAVTPIPIASGTAAGSYYLLAQADGAQALDESSETNNVTAELIQVTIVP